jgi:signal transduction histidine kinase
MAGRRHSIASTFIIILGLGALAVAVVAIAVTFSASAEQRIRDAERNRAAVDLLEQRLDLTSLIVAEEAAAVVDEINGAGSMETAPITAQRITAVKTASERLDTLTQRADSVGNESQRWLAAVKSITEPTDVADPYERLIAYDAAVEAICCAGIVPSDEHHGIDLADLDAATLLPQSVWQYFYLDVERASRRGPGVPAAVSQFTERLGIPTRIEADTPLPGDVLATGLSALSSLGISHDAISTLLAGTGVETLDNIVLNAADRSSIVVTTDEAFAAAEAVGRSIGEMVREAIASSRDQLDSDIGTSEQIRLVARILAPLLLVVLAAFGYLAYTFARSREQAAAREQDLLDARNRFMRMVSHELRTPATAISGFAEMMASDWTALTEPEINEFLAIIDRQSTHLSLIVDDLLTLSHLETGRLRLHLGIVNLKAAATEGISLVDHRYGIEVATTIDPTITLLADSDRLVQIIRNLVENAAKYGKVDVAISAAIVGSSCEIVVSDSGPGVPPNMRSRIFRFWDRGEKDGSRARGYGMGLAIARHLARAMVGDLTYRPHHPVGSELVLSLPLGPPDVNTDATPIGRVLDNSNSDSMA